MSYSEFTKELLTVLDLNLTFHENDQTIIGDSDYTN
ncbi:hypothetical protein UAK_02732 [Enterococcus raffinosus ATCC 49464]|uniref:Uncharacterized protein n=1 Tax=Enterococcus raffinosus ATCC 49464 TaxID=1158602 RepID=R2P1N8_9ENTE|nr:hypothetical protein UAK_02732 [Enterococcus raffinosus ATCC 49464]EOT75851.1 hypothetical protein I590_02676 [Enterococcus raffinosus ATCC 49464]